MAEASYPVAYGPPPPPRFFLGGGCGGAQVVKCSNAFHGQNGAGLMWGAGLTASVEVVSQRGRGHLSRSHPFATRIAAGRQAAAELAQAAVMVNVVLQGWSRRPDAARGSLRSANVIALTRALARGESFQGIIIISSNCWGGRGGGCMIWDPPLAQLLAVAKSDEHCFV